MIYHRQGWIALSWSVNIYLVIFLSIKYFSFRQYPHGGTFHADIRQLRLWLRINMYEIAYSVTCSFHVLMQWSYVVLQCENYLTLTHAKHECTSPIKDRLTVKFVNKINLWYYLSIYLSIYYYKAMSVNKFNILFYLLNIMGFTTTVYDLFLWNYSTSSLLLLININYYDQQPIHKEKLPRSDWTRTSICCHPTAYWRHRYYRCKPSI